MNKCFLVMLLTGIVSASAWSINDAGAKAPAVQQTRQADGALVTDRPFSAMQTVTLRRVLPDGDEFTRQTVTKLYRDSAGRMRRDTLNDDGEPDHSFITELDGSMIFLDHANQLVSMRGGGRQAAARDDIAEGPADAPIAGRKAGPIVEALGERDIEGVAATGLMMRRQVGPEGESVEVTDESWYSKEWKISLYRKHSDPRIGETVSELSELDRREPDRALFAGPVGYEPLGSQYGRN
jgi:hypothetical protein